MKIKEEQIDINNIEVILERELNDIKQNRDTTELYISIRKIIYNIFNDSKVVKKSELKELKDNIYSISAFLVELMYGNHELI